MKRIFTFTAVALMTSAVASSAFAGWGPNGMFGNADPNARPVGQSSTPSNHPASAPILNPPDPTKNLGAVPGGYFDPSLKISKAQQAARIAKAKANFDKKQYSPRLAPENMSGNMSHNNSSLKHQYTNGIPFMPTSNKQTSGYGGNADADPMTKYNMGRYGSKYGPYTPSNTSGGSGYGSNGNNGGFFGNDVTNRPRPTTNYPQQFPTNMNNYPHHTQYPTNMNSGYPKGSSYPPQNQPTTGGYGTQASSAGWGGYGGQSSSGSASWGPSNSGYGGQANSQYGMFAR